MRVNPGDLPERLNGGLPPAILLHGEEPLLVEESAAHVRRAAGEQGFDDRIPLSAETGFDWGRLTGSSRTLSLFARRRLIELRLPGKPGDTGAQALAAFCESAAEDVCLLVITGGLDGRSKQARWVKALDSAGWAVEHRALDAGQFQGWLRRRLGQRGVRLEKESIDRLCHFLEGNLLAAAQEIDRIALFADGDGRVDPEVVSGGLADHARFNVFELTDACLDGDARKALRILRILRAEGSPPALVCSILAREVRTVCRLAQGREMGRPRGELYKACGVWRSRVPRFDAALSRIDPAASRRLAGQAARCDRVVKGRQAGEPWQQLGALVLMMCDSHYVERHPVFFRAAD